MIRKLATAIFISAVLCSATTGADNVLSDQFLDFMTPKPFPFPTKANLRTILTLCEERPMEISLPERIVVGEPCETEITVTNDSNEVIYAPSTLQNLNVSILLINSKSETMALTEYGKQNVVITPLENSLFPDGGFDGRGGIRLEPGESHTWTIEVANCFDLPPDTYTARFSILLFHPGEFVKFEVHPWEK